MCIVSDDSCGSPTSLPTPLSQAAFDASLQQNLSVMKLFPGSAPSTPLLRPQGHTPLSAQTYPADFSNYGPMYNSYYSKQAMVGMANSRSSPYQRNMYSPTNPGQCYNNFQGGASLYHRPNYDYSAHNPR